MPVKASLDKAPTLQSDKVCGEVLSVIGSGNRVVENFMNEYMEEIDRVLDEVEGRIAEEKERIGGNLIDDAIAEVRKEAKGIQELLDAYEEFRCEPR